MFYRRRKLRIITVKMCFVLLNKGKAYKNINFKKLKFNVRVMLQ